MPCTTHGNNCDGGCKDPNADNGMMTKVWGPPGWLFLHCVTFGYPYVIIPSKKEHQEKMIWYRNFFHQLGHVLPCRYCRESYQDFMKEDPIDNHLKSRKEITKWFYDMHNKVNKKLGVPPCDIPSFEDMTANYEQYRAKCKKTTDEERKANVAKGCVNPADGTKKRCVVKVVQCGTGDITRRNNAKETSDEVKKEANSEDYFVFEKNQVYLLSFLVIILLSVSFYYASESKTLKKTLKNLKLS